MKVKYKTSPIWFALGIVWAALTFYLFNRYIPETDGVYFSRRLISLVILPTLLSLYFFLMPFISYLKIRDDKILIHKSILIFNFKINRSDLLHCRVLGQDLIFFTKGEKNYTLHLDWCHRKQVIEAIRYIQSFASVYDGNSNRMINLSDIDIITKVEK